MQQCPGCDYLVPLEWSECKRCGEDLAGAPAAAPAGAPTAAVTAATPATTAAVPASEAPPRPAPAPAPAPPAPPAPATPAAGAAPSWTPPPRPATTGAPGPIPGMPAVPPPPLGQTPPGGLGPGPAGPPGGGDVPTTTFWRPESAPLPSAPKRRGLPTWARLVVGAVAVVGGWWVGGKVTDRLFAPDVPDAVAAYADGAGSSAYVHPRYGYSVDLPGVPQVQAIPFSVMDQQFQVDMAYVETPEMMAGVMVLQLPPGMPVDPEELLDGGLAGIASQSGVEVTAEEATTHEGRPAVDVSLDADGAEGKLRLVVDGSRAYVALLAAPVGADDAFDHLVETWHLQGPGLSA